MSKRHVAGALAVIICAGTVGAQEEKPAGAEAKEHGFLKQFVGTWDCDGEAFIEPGQAPTKMKSSMTGHMIGNFWAVVVVTSEGEGQPYHGQGTFGYDSRKKKYIGTWADSMSEFLWRYEGTVDGDKLVLNSEGPNPADPGKMIKARDTWEFKSPDLIVLTGQMEGPDGKMTTMMTATCTRQR